MAQRYTNTTPIEDFRRDFLHRESVCRALFERYPALRPVADQAAACVIAIDGRRVELQAADDLVVRTHALEVALQLDVIDAYRIVRKQFEAYHPEDLFSFLPDSPSELGNVGDKRLIERSGQALENLRRLPENDPVRHNFMPPLERALIEFVNADAAGDNARRNYRGVVLALTTYRTELAQVRDEQLGNIQAVLRDHSRTDQFTLPWRRPRAKTKGPVEPTK